MPVLTLYPDRQLIDIGHGRHRFWALQAAGYDVVTVLIPSEVAELAKEQIGV